MHNTAPKWGSLSLRIIPPPFLFSCVFVCSPISSSFFFFLLQIPRVRLSPDQKMWLGSPRYKVQLTLEQRHKFELQGPTSNMDFLFLSFKKYSPALTILGFPACRFNQPRTENSFHIPNRRFPTVSPNPSGKYCFRSAIGGICGCEGPLVEWNIILRF